jgi:hypothetical protein
MESVISALIIFLVILLICFLSSLIDKFCGKRKDEFIDKTIEKAIDKVSSVVTSKIAMVLEKYKTGPWYLVVYTAAEGQPIWISNNNIRSVHPDAKKRRLIVKLFNGEDMVIEDVESYDIQAANEMADFDFL